MFNLKLVSCILCSSLWYGCTEHTNISFSCEKDKKDNYIVKWEVFPDKDNAKIELYSSDNDSIFPKSPRKTSIVNDYIAILPPTNNATREYFKLKIGKTYSGIISNRVFEMDSVQNFRDLGGYTTTDNKQMRWGKVYRSGNLSKLSEHDENILKSLGIHTVIDLRGAEQVTHHPNAFIAANYFKLPIEVNNFGQEIQDKILDGYFLKGDAIIYTQDCYKTVIDDYTLQYSTFFDILCNENNYPVLFHCGLGKDRSGIAAYFLMKALDIPSNIIDEDYLLSNQCIDKLKIMHDVQSLPESMQEAITMLSKADIAHLKYAISCMKKKSGSVNEYMSEELGLTDTKKEKLKQILLYY